MTTTAIEKTANGAVALPEPVTRRGISEAQWRTLCNSLYPGANPLSVLLVWDYCVARRLDPLKKPCHIVPMEVKDAKSGKYEWRDVVMPGIYELRTTAQRTGQYLGHAPVVYGEPMEFMGVKAPEWCEFTAYRWNPLAMMRAEYPVRVLFREVVATKKDGKANARWAKAPVQMLCKCSEAASLREAFPDELGGVHAEEEMDGQRAIDVQAEDKPAPTLVKPDNYDSWLPTLATAAKAGLPAFEKAWEESAPACRQYLTATDPDSFEDLRESARTEATA